MGFEIIKSGSNTNSGSAEILGAELVTKTAKLGSASQSALVTKLLISRRIVEGYLYSTADVKKKAHNQSSVSLGFAVDREKSQIYLFKDTDGSGYTFRINKHTLTSSIKVRDGVPRFSNEKPVINLTATREAVDNMDVVRVDLSQTDVSWEDDDKDFSELLNAAV